MKYNKKAAYEQIAATALKSKKLPQGAELSIIDVLEGTVKFNGREVKNDTFICQGPSGKIRVPARELLRFATAEGKESYQNADEENIEIPNKFKIVSMTDRKDQSGNTIMPLQAYNLREDFLAGKLNWNQLVAGGLREDVKYDAVQNYVIAAL